MRGKDCKMLYTFKDSIKVRLTEILLLRLRMPLNASRDRTSYRMTVLPGLQH